MPYTGEFKDAQAYFAQRQGQPQIQMTPQIGKAAVEATAPPKDTGGERIAPVTPPADALPVRPAEPAITPPPATSPQTQYVPGGTLPQGNAPQQLSDAAQGNSVALLSLSPTQPVDQLSTPLTQSIGAGSMSPIPWQEVQGWGWSPSSVDMGGMNMGGGGGGKFGGAGGFMGGGD